MDYLTLIKDTIAFVKQEKLLPFSECFSIQLTKKEKPPIKSYPFKPVVKKISEESLLEVKPVVKKKKEMPFKEEIKKPEIIEDRFEDVKKTVRTIDANIHHVDKILEDSEAKKFAQNWKYQSKIAPILILFSAKNQNEKTFLSNLANAISIYFVQTKVLDAAEIEKENTWDHILDPEMVKFVIAPDDQIWDLPNLMKGYKENPSQSTVTLKGIPLFLIPDLKMYFQNPTLKGSLWKALCQKISPLHPLS